MRDLRGAKFFIEVVRKCKNMKNTSVLKEFEHAAPRSDGD